MNLVTCLWVMAGGAIGTLARFLIANLMLPYSDKLPVATIAINITGGPYKGVSSFQQTYGTVDAHTHGMAFEFLGGALHCGKPWDRYGVTVALRDCPDHESTGGYGAAFVLACAFLICASSATSARTAMAARRF